MIGLNQGHSIVQIVSRSSRILSGLFDHDWLAPKPSNHANSYFITSGTDAHCLIPIDSLKSHRIIIGLHAQSCIMIVRAVHPGPCYPASLGACMARMLACIWVGPMLAHCRAWSVLPPTCAGPWAMQAISDLLSCMYFFHVIFV